MSGIQNTINPDDYPLPDNMFWNNNYGKLTYGARDKVDPWWHGWAFWDYDDETWKVEFDRREHADADKAAPQAPRYPVACESEEQAYSYLSNMLMMGFR